MPTLTLEKTTTLALEGSKNLSPEDAAALEYWIADNPSDLDGRIKLIGFYFLRWFQDSDAAAARIRHVLWVIANVPESYIAGMPFANISASAQPDAYNQAKTQWLDHVDRRPENPTIIKHAAQFFRTEDHSVVERLLQMGQALEPENGDWVYQRGFLRYLQLIATPHYPCTFGKMR